MQLIHYMVILEQIKTKEQSELRGLVKILKKKDIANLKISQNSLKRKTNLF